MSSFSSFSKSFCFGIAAISALLGGNRQALALEDDPPGAYQAPAPDPSPVETLMLEYINRCRANPAEDGVRCSASSFPDVDMKMFLQEMSAEHPAPPLVFDLRILKAARWHCHYQIVNGQGHAEEEGKEGFTGVSPSDRVKRASFPGLVAENAFVGPKDPWSCHSSFVVDFGKGPGGMQPGRGHRRNILNPDHRLAGVGAVPYDGDKRFACTHNFSGASERFAGGVVINDRNKNHFYDMGEGVPGVALSAGGESLKSWFSGAYTLPIPSTNAKLTVELEGKKYSVLLPDGKENVKFDVLVNEKQNFHAAAGLLASIKKLPPGDAGDSRRLAAEIDLYFVSQSTLVEDELLDEIQAITGPVREKVNKDMEDARKAVADAEVSDARQLARGLSQKYSRTRARSWFADALVTVEIRDGYQSLASLKGDGKAVTPAMVGRILKKQQGLFQQLTSPEWKKIALDWVTKTNSMSGATPEAEK